MSPQICSVYDIVYFGNIQAIFDAVSLEISSDFYLAPGVLLNATHIFGFIRGSSFFYSICPMSK